MKLIIIILLVVSTLFALNKDCSEC